MDRITADHPDAKSRDLVADNIDRLRQIFPQAFTEGKVDFDALRALLGDAVDDGDERYGLSWHGKAQARRLALTPSTGTLRPDRDASVDWDTTQNLILEGDNLEVLKLLQKSYAGKVKLIYIDPPYNTGNDFVYDDDFRDNIANYLEKTGQVDGEGVKVSSNAEASGRFHTAWLNMMYPRLMLARQLLAEDGVIFITVDGGEVANLRHILDQVFGPENRVAHIAWQRKYSASNNAKGVAPMVDHVVAYCRGGAFKRGLFPRSAEAKARYQNLDDDPRGPWKPVDYWNLASPEQRPNLVYPIINPNTGEVIHPSKKAWKFAKDKYEEHAADNRIYWGKDGTNTVPALKLFLSEVRDGVVPTDWWPWEFAGHTDAAKKALERLIGPGVFDTPKPTKLVYRMLQLGAVDKGGLVLDFFAGSGTTADAVMQQNAEDGGNRRFILVQLPEATDREDYPTIAHITRERVRRAARKLRDDNPLLAKTQDLGFRAYRLDSTNLKPWDPTPRDVQGQIDSHIEHIKPGRTEDDLLTEVLLKLGLDLTVPIETREIEGLRVHNIGAGQLLVCLGQPITRATAAPLARGLLTWQAASRPTDSDASTATALFRDSAFKDDVAKQNVVATLQQGGLTQVRSL